MTPPNPFPRPGAEMMAERKAALAAPRRRGFDRLLFRTQRLRADGRLAPGPPLDELVEEVVDLLSTPPEGSGIGYCLIEGVSAGRTVEEVRRLSFRLLNEIWERYRLRNHCFGTERDFYCAETLTLDGAIPPELFGSRWSFKPPHADRNGVLFAHVYGPAQGFRGGEVIVIDAISYLAETALTFDEAFTWSDEPAEQKPVLRPEHVAGALDCFGRNFGKMDYDSILIVNNSPNGLLHGATELEIFDDTRFERALHRSVVRERSGGLSATSY